MKEKTTFELEDDREPRLIELGRKLAVAIEAEEEARKRHDEAMGKRMEIEKEIVRIGGYINAHLGQPEEGLGA